jgi:hypothetical protein
VRRTVVVGSFILLGAIATAASVGMMKMNQLREDAKDNLVVAKRKGAETAQALEDLKAAETRKAEAEKLEKKAEEERRLAQIAAANAGKALGLSKEQLEAANVELQKTAAEAKAAQVAAEASRKKAVEAAADAQRAKAELQVKLDAEKQRVRKLEEEKRKLSTKLKE